MKILGALVPILLTARFGMGEELIIRETRQGQVKGRILEVLNVFVEEYRSIPFAEPPIGNFRFKPPVPKSSWSGIHEARGNGTACPQPLPPGLSSEGLNYTEDCLHLNVWAPTPYVSTKAPVYVWIHGGGFWYGSSTSEDYNGAYLAAKSRLVVVSMNYRLGVLGFLNADSPEAPGNMGLLDQHLALKWIQENIEIFGGDPEAVTISGESSGAISVHAHVLSPMSKGLYKRAIMMSGTANTLDFFQTDEEGLKKGNDVSRKVGCSNGEFHFGLHKEEVLRCLRLKSANDLVFAAQEIAAPKVGAFYPTYHDQFLPHAPQIALEQGLFSNVSVLAGTTSDEGALALLFPKRSEFLEITSQLVDRKELKRSVYGTVNSWTKFEVPEMLEYYESRAAVGDAEALRRGYIDYLSDKLFNCPLQFFSEKHSLRGNAVYRYVFGQKWYKWMIPEWMGTPHAVDLSYVFARPLVFQNDFTEEDRIFTEHVVEVITSFSKFG